ncbi:MAG: type 1 glutamine amidotransferase domain-containing protein [Burkholderiales bacterium]|jgi:putative intracellular protease/amidase|nr:type 1 glutamine amidotransferase domain-containing protein [Burkholderiales bacterium]
MPRALFILTSHAVLGTTGRPTGWYVPEAAHPWAVLRAAGVDVVFASPAGAAAHAIGADRADPVQTAFLDDAEVQQRLATAPRTADVDPADIDAVLFVGGHGTMWDFPSDAAAAALTRHVWNAGGVVAAVCHGPAGLVDVTVDGRRPLVAGRRVAAFTDSEERRVGLDGVVPFLLASTLVARGAVHVPAPDFVANTVVDGRLVTGQNPASAHGVGGAMARLLGAASRAAA